MNYKPGEKVWVLWSPGNEYAGVVLEFLEALPCDHCGGAVYKVSITDGPGGVDEAAICDKLLRPRFDEGEPNKVVRWADCPWKPKVEATS